MPNPKYTNRAYEVAVQNLQQADRDSSELYRALVTQARQAAEAKAMQQAKADQARQMLESQTASAQELANKYPGRAVNVEGVSLGGAPSPHELQLKLTPAQEAYQRSAGTQIANYDVAGGKATFDKNIELLQNTSKDLERAPGERGLLTRAAGVLPDKLRDFLTPAERAREDRVKTAIQSTLRQTLGAQFTKEEGEAMMNRAYNPRASSEENQARLNAAIQELQDKRGSVERAKNAFSQTGYADVSPPAMSNPGIGALGVGARPSVDPEKEKRRLEYEALKRKAMGK